jgi:hypothetical protein
MGHHTLVRRTAAHNLLDHQRRFHQSITHGHTWQ